MAVDNALEDHIAASAGGSDTRERAIRGDDASVHTSNASVVCAWGMQICCAATVWTGGLTLVPLPCAHACPTAVTPHMSRDPMLTAAVRHHDAPTT